VRGHDPAQRPKGRWADIASEPGLIDPKEGPARRTAGVSRGSARDTGGSIRSGSQSENALEIGDFGSHSLEVSLSMA